MPYTEPTAYKEVGDEILTNFGQEAELHDRTVMVDIMEVVDDEEVPTGEQVEEPNDNFTRHRNANSRVWLKNRKALRILVEVDGVVDTQNPLAVVNSSCGAAERQPVYVRVRPEEPTDNLPTDPALEVAI